MKKSFDWRRLARVGAVLVAASLPAMPTSSQDQHLGAIQRVRGESARGETWRSLVSGVIQITIDGWSTEAERVSLVEAFESGGQERLLRELERRKAVGYVRLPTTLRYDLHFSRQSVAPDGTRRIILATDREMTAYEEAKRPITSDIPVHHNRAAGQQGRRRRGAAVGTHEDPRQQEGTNHRAGKLR